VRDRITVIAMVLARTVLGYSVLQLLFLWPPASPVGQFEALAFMN